MEIIEEKYFAGNFDMFQMIIPTKALNDNGKIKVPNNNVFDDQLSIFKTLGNHRIKSNNGTEVLMTNFIELPIYNKGDNYVRFYITKHTATMLLNNINGYEKVYRSLLFSTPSTMPLNVFLYVKKKFGKMNGGIIAIKKFVDELGLAQHYLKRSKLEVFLNGIKHKLNDIASISFGFKIEKDNIIFTLYETNNTVLIEYASNDEYQAQNALKYIKKKRNLSEEHLVYIRAKFIEHNYEKMRLITYNMLNRPHFMKAKFYFILIFFPIFLFSQEFGKVVSIKDGDTVVVLFGDNIQKTLRLAEVDCPESGQPFGKNAKQFTSSQVLGKEIMFYETDTDRYGRTIAKIYYDHKKYLSEELIKAGLGWWYFRYSNNRNLGYLESQARAKSIGLWQDPKAIAPWEWRKINK